MEEGMTNQRNYPSLNVSVDQETYDVMKEKYPRMTSMIFRGLSKAFLREIDDHPEMLDYVIRGDITLRYKEVKKSSE